MAEVNYESVEPFGVDHGELDGLTPAECFTLGVEWQMVCVEAGSPEGFSRPIHSRNRDRLSALLLRRERRFSVTFMHDDPSESWLWLSVEPKEGQ